jgi:hypothetical protein
MKMLSSLAIAVLLAASLPAQAQQGPQERDTAATQPKAVGGPLKLIYRVSGVRNTPGTQQTLTIGPNQTLTMSTHGTTVFFENYFLVPGIEIGQGSGHILATSNKIFCSAMIVDAAVAVPQGITLHMVRYDPVPGTQE